MTHITRDKLRAMFEKHHVGTTNPFCTIIGGEKVLLNDPRAFVELAWLCDALNELAEKESREADKQIHRVYSEAEDL